MTLKLNGSTDGSVSLDAPADTSPTGTDITLTLPTTVGSANQFVKNGGTAGELEYSSMVEDSSGRLLVGTTTAGAFTNRRVSIATSSGTTALELRSATDGDSRIVFTDSTDSADSGSFKGQILYDQTSDYMSFNTNGNNERMRIKSSGDVEFASSSFGTNTNNYDVNAANSVIIRNSSATKLQVANVAATCISANRDGDGNLLSFYESGSFEGSISVSGTTVSYNGAHLARWSQLPGGVERTEILRGSVLSNIDEMCEWAYEAQDAVLYTEEDELPEGVSVGDVKTPAVAAGTEDNEQLNRMKVSDVEGDVNVSGVFQAWDDDDDTYTNDFYCAMTGDFVIRIAQGTTVARGDLLMSAGDGTAKPQDDDIVRSKTIAKVTSTTVSTTYSDGSYCVPCVLMAC
jgi:hypothetical protein